MNARGLRVFLCLLGALPLAAAEKFEPALKSPAALTVPSEIVAYAKAHGLATEGLELAPTAGAGAPGDAITALVIARDGKAAKYWLTHFTWAAATEKERSGRPATITMNLGGHEHAFTADAPVALEIRTVGPFLAGAKSPPEEKQARALVSPAFLGLGIDRACEAIMQSAAASAKATAAGKPPEVVLAPEAEHALAGLFPAMFEFLQGVQKTPGLREILLEVIDKPSIWSFVKRAGKIDAGFDFDTAYPFEPATWGIAGMPCYRLPAQISINDKPALRCAFFVTSPRPPLLTTAGILGIVAESPSDSGRHVDIRILAARRAAPATPPAAR